MCPTDRTNMRSVVTITVCVSADGVGDYVFPGGVRFCGTFNDGAFDGAGSITTNSNFVFNSEWKNGTCIATTSIRRPQDYRSIPPSQWEEYINEYLPYQCIDVGDGYLHIQSNRIYEYQTFLFKRTCSTKEKEWAINKCSVGRNPFLEHPR